MDCVGRGGAREIEAPLTLGARRRAWLEYAAMKKARIAELFERLAAALPEPKSELEHDNPYTLLVAVVLSAQATDAGVNKATGPLFELVDTPARMLALGESRLKDHIKSIGLFNTKAKNIMGASETVCPETTLLLTSLTVTVIVEVAVPSATTFDVGLATAVDSEAEMLLASAMKPTVGVVVRTTWPAPGLMVTVMVLVSAFVDAIVPDA